MCEINNTSPRNKLKLKEKDSWKKGFPVIKIYQIRPKTWNFPQQLKDLDERTRYT